MTHKWQRKKISELCTLIVDCVNKTAPSVQYVTPFKMIRTSNIKNGRINLSDCRHVEKETYEKWTRRTTVQKSDVLLTREAPMGEVGLVNFNETTFLGQRIMQYRANPKLLDANYLLYSFLSPDLQFQFRRHNNSGSIVSHICVPDCFEFEINTPPLDIQKRIGKTLSDLDSKIELNNRINTELEAMAKLIYDYWFVQFDFPDENGKPYKSSGGKMVWSEELKRKIPVGWEYGTLFDIAAFTNGLACQKFRPQNGEDSLRVIKIREMSDGFTNNSEFVSRNIPDKLIVKNGDILFSWSATLDVKIWTSGIGALNQHIFKVTSEKYPRSYYYFELLNYLQHFKMIAELRKTTMGHITQDHLKQSRIVIPPKIIIDQLHAIIDSTLNRIVKNQEENQKLSELRDWLLPMLMNGQITVSDAKSSAKTIDLKAKVEHYQQRKILANYILSQSAIDLSLGKVKFEKLLHLSEYHIVKEQQHQQYEQHAAGPLDAKFTYRFFKEAESEGIISFKKQGALQQIVVNKKAIAGTGEQFSKETRSQIDALIQLFMGSNYEKPEIISTLYAVWNNRIIKNELITDELLKQDFLAWDPQKAKYKDQLDKNLAWMRKEGIVPDGWGEVIEGS
jgi:type I restriction enzyme S subunit